MIQLEERVSVKRTADEAFLYLADFANLAGWDPGIVRASRVDAGPLAEGAHFAVVARFLGRDVPMSYELARYDVQARHAVLVGTAPGIRATDRITVTPRPDGAEVHWQADFELSGANRFFGPLMRPLFRRLARVSMDGLRARLG